MEGLLKNYESRINNNDDERGNIYSEPGTRPTVLCAFSHRVHRVLSSRRGYLSAEKLNQRG